MTHEPEATNLDPAVLDVDVLRVEAGTARTADDVVAVEEPLEIRLGGQRFVVIMRTPGEDRPLIAGFLLSEQILSAASEIASIRACADDAGRPVANVQSVWLQGEAAVRAQRALVGRRHVVSSTSCGVCGRQSIDDLLDGVRCVPSGAPSIAPDVITRLPGALRAAQQVFSRTGGLHAAGLFDPDGRLVFVAEDVGRHNAVDKVVGQALLAGETPLATRILFVSGRTSFEIVQKAVVAGIPTVASVSAPSSLAVDLARDAGVTLIGFVRDRGFNVYCGQERLMR